jgi:hypothetical protein
MTRLRANSDTYVDLMLSPFESRLPTIMSEATAAIASKHPARMRPDTVLLFDLILRTIVENNGASTACGAVALSACLAYVEGGE